MKLSFEEIKSITFGTVDFWQEADGIHYTRCTREQIAYWDTVRPAIGEGARRTTGISFDFHTDSSRAVFTFAGCNHFDIYVDGILAQLHLATDPVCEVALPEGEHRVTFILPSHSNDRPWLQSLELDDGARWYPHRFDSKILFMGDSITQGWCSSRDSFSWAWNVCLARNAQCLNQGIGSTIAAPKAFPHGLDYDPDTVVVAFGTNDWVALPSLEKLKENHDRLWELVTEKYAGKRLIGISPFFRFNTQTPRAMGSFAECCQVVKQSIVDHGATLLDGDGVIPHQEQFFKDGVHPLDIGYKCASDHLLKLL